MFGFGKKKKVVDSEETSQVLDSVSDSQNSTSDIDSSIDSESNVKEESIQESFDTEDSSDDSLEVQEDNHVFPDDFFSLDSENLLKQLKTLSDTIKESYYFGDGLELFEAVDFDNIFFVGMGGSSISGAILKSFLESQGFKKPIYIVEDYNLPNTFSKNSLAFVISYSGNTEETISAYREAIKKSNYVIALATGGHLEEICNVNRKPFLKVPKGFQPRTAALSYLLFPLLRIIERLGLIDSQEDAVLHLRNSIKKTDFNKFAVSLSEKLVGTIPVIYASDKYFTVAYRFKCEINENAKVHAFCNKYSEFNHNELCAYENLQANYHIVTFRFDDDHRRIKKRMDIVKDLTKKAGVSTTEIKFSGDFFLTKLLSAILLGDYTAYYLALRYGVDPSPVNIIEGLKKQLGPFI